MDGDTLNRIVDHIPWSTADESARTRHLMTLSVDVFGKEIPAEVIERRIYLIRGQKVMLDSDLAFLYQVLTKNLNLAVRRNASRFPPDFMFQLTREEAESSRLQIATLKKGRGSNIKYLPYAFTELGVAMLSSVLSSERAILVNIAVMRAFVKLRELLIRDKDLAARVEKLEAENREHKSIIAVLADEIDSMKRLPEPKRRGIGFTANLNE